MRERIIIQSIESLRQEGLKFSIDTVAERLNVSKKTIYKFFPDKQTLAIAIYERYYADTHAEIKGLAGDKSESALVRLLGLYYDAKLMTSSEIFNKYKLNDALRTYTTKQNDNLFKAVYPSLRGSAEYDEAPLRIIIDGTFEKLCAQKTAADDVINFLVKVILK